MLSQFTGDKIDTKELKQLAVDSAAPSVAAFKSSRGYSEGWARLHHPSNIIVMQHHAPRTA